MATRTQIPDSQARQFASELSQLRTEVDALKRSLRAAQLGHSTIEDGSLAFTDSTGTVRGKLGIGADGTFSTIAQNAPPPPTPSLPQVTPIATGGSITWDGVFANGAPKPGDFAFVEIHVGGADNFIPSESTLIGTFSDPGTWIHAPLESSNIYYAKFVATNTSQTKSPPTTGVSFQPQQVVAQDVLDGIITEVKLANDAVTQAKIATGAVGSGEIQGNAVGTAQLASGAVDATKLIDGAVVQGKVAANAIGANEIAANSIVAGKIAANAVTTSTIAANAVNADKIAASSISADKIAANAVTAEKINALAVTADKIAANSINAGHITAGAVTAAKLAAQLVLASTIIAGNPTGARIQLTSTGIEGYRANGTKSLDFDTATGDMTVAGVYRSGDSAERIQILTDGTQRFYPNSGTNYGLIENVSGSVRMRGPLDGSNRAGHMAFSQTDAFLRFGTPGGTNLSSVWCGGTYVNTVSPFTGLRVDGTRSPADGTSRRIAFGQTNSSGNDIGDSFIHYYRRSSSNGILIGTSNSGLVWDDNQLSVTTGNDTTYGTIAAASFPVGSSENVKENIAEISIPEDRTSWDVIEGAPSLEWHYTFEGKRSEKPEANGAPVRLKRHKVDINGLPIVHPDGTEEFEFYDAEWKPDTTPVRKLHKFPIAEDLASLDPELVRHGPNGPDDLGVDLRDMIGVLWDAVDMLIKRNRILEDKLTQRLPNLTLPVRPQKGDVQQGVGAVIAGRTRRTLDATTGQVRRNSRAK